MACMVPITTSGAMYGVSGSPTAGADPLLAGVPVLAEPQVPRHVGRARQLTLDAHRPAAIGLGDLRPVEPELVDQLLVAGDAAVRRRQRLAGEHAAQARRGTSPSRWRSWPRRAVVERVGERERGAVAVRRELERQPVGAPCERQPSRRVDLLDRAGRAGSPSNAAKRIAPPGRRSMSTGLGNHGPRCSGVVTASHTFSIGCG